MSKYLDSNGVTYLWQKLSLNDYPNNGTLVSIINAIDETKANKNETPSLDPATGLVLASQLPQISNTYSTEEQVSGAWIDGRTIYKRTVVYSQTFTSTNHWAYYIFADHEDTKDMAPTQYIKIEGSALVYSEVHSTAPCWQPIPRICPDATVDYSIGMGDFQTNKIGVLFGEKYTSATIYLTFEYLKD